MSYDPPDNLELMVDGSGELFIFGSPCSEIKIAFIENQNDLSYTFSRFTPL